MPRPVVALVAGASLAIAAVGAGLWQAERQAQREAAGRDSAAHAQPIAEDATANDVVTPEAEIDLAALEKASSETGNIDEHGSPPTLDPDAELQAAFAELLDDPDPEVRREAGQLAREFPVLSGE